MLKNVYGIDKNPNSDLFCIILTTCIKKIK